MSHTLKNSIIVGTIIIGFAGLSVYLNQTEPVPEPTPTAATTAPEQAPTSSDSSRTDTNVSAGSYQTYSEEAVALSDADTKILFFHATWCPTCKVADRDITESMADIPPDVAIFKTDYDTALALRQQHGVTLQHSFVLLDENDQTAKRWTNSRNLEEILAEL